MVEARQSGTNIVKEIISCEKYQVLCIDPEHLNEKEWQEVVKLDKFWSNIVYVCVEEAHLINEWGASFRPLFKRIGQLICGRVPSSCAVFALTATLQPGKDTASVCQALGFCEGNYFLVRRSNERPNIHFAIETLKHGVNSDVFPQLLPYLNSGRKAIIHCSTIDQVYRVYVYLWSMEPDHADHMRRVRMYFSLSSDEYNRETIRLLNDDSYCQVVIATVAFANGINCRTLLDSISIGAAKTLDQIWQEKGRVARILELAGHSVVLVQPSDLKAAEKLINGSNTSIQGQNDVLIRKLVGIFHTTTKKKPRQMTLWITRRLYFWLRRFAMLQPSTVSIGIRQPKRPIWIVLLLNDGFPVLYAALEPISRLSLLHLYILTMLNYLRHFFCQLALHQVLALMPRHP